MINAWIGLTVSAYVVVEMLDTLTSIEDEATFRGIVVGLLALAAAVIAGLTFVLLIAPALSS